MSPSSRPKRGVQAAEDQLEEKEEDETAEEASPLNVYIIKFMLSIQDQNVLITVVF